MAGECHLGVGCVEGRGDRDLVLCSRRDVEGSLPHYWHVEMMHDRHLQHCAVTAVPYPDISHLQTLTPLVIITVVKGLYVKQYREPIVLASLGALLDSSEPVVPVSVRARGDGAGIIEQSDLYLCLVVGSVFVCLKGMINVNPVSLNTNTQQVCC